MREVDSITVRVRGKSLIHIHNIFHCFCFGFSSTFFSFSKRIFVTETETEKLKPKPAALCSLTRTGENEAAVGTQDKRFSRPKQQRDLRDLTAKRCVTNQFSCLRFRLHLHLRLWVLLQLLLFIQFPLFNCFAAAEEGARVFSFFFFIFGVFLLIFCWISGTNCRLFRAELRIVCCHFERINGAFCWQCWKLSNKWKTQLHD